MEKKDGVFHVKTNKQQHVASAVLLGIGRRGTPRKLGVPGEALPKVVYRLIDPEQYRGQKVIVVGGGDSALEAAASIAELGDTQVHLSYRGDAFQRAKQRNRQRVDEATQKGQLNVLLNSQISEIRPDEVTLKQSGKEMLVEQRRRDRQRRRHPAERFSEIDRHRSRNQVRHRVMQHASLSSNRRARGLIAALCCGIALCASAASVKREPPKKDPLEPARAALRTLQFDKAIALLKTAGDGGNADAQYLLGLMYLNGVGVAADSARGRALIAERGRARPGRSRLCPRR